MGKQWVLPQCVLKTCQIWNLFGVVGKVNHMANYSNWDPFDKTHFKTKIALKVFEVIWRCKTDPFFAMTK